MNIKWYQLSYKPRIEFEKLTLLELRDYLAHFLLLNANSISLKSYDETKILFSTPNTLELLNNLIKNNFEKFFKEYNIEPIEIKEDTEEPNLPVIEKKSESYRINQIFENRNIRFKDLHTSDNFNESLEFFFKININKMTPESISIKKEIERRVTLLINRMNKVGKTIVDYKINEDGVEITYKLKNEAEKLSLQIQKDKPEEGLKRDYNELLVKESRTFDNLLNNKLLD